MSGIALPTTGGNAVGEKINRGEEDPGILTATLLRVAFALTVATAQTTLPARLESPDRGVVCNHERAICYDRYGASIGLTEAFLGHVAAERLTTNLRNSGTDHRPGT